MPQCLRGTGDTGMATVTRIKLDSVATHIAVTTHIDISKCIFHKSRVHQSSPTQPPKDAITLQSFPPWSSQTQLGPRRMLLPFSLSLCGAHRQSQREGFRLCSERAKRCLPVIHLGKDHFWKLKKPRKERKEGGKGKKNPSYDARLFVLWTES